MIINPVVVDMDVGGILEVPMEINVRGQYEMDVGTSIRIAGKLQEKSATPTEETIYVVPDAGYALSRVTVAPIPENYGRIARIGANLKVY